MSLLRRAIVYTTIGGLVGFKVNHVWNNGGLFSDTPVKGTAKAFRHSEKLEEKLNNLDLVKKLSKDPQHHKLRPWDYANEDKNRAVFTSGPLYTPGGISIPPLLFANEDERSIVTIIHCGHFLAGFPFIVHGGILSTALDEALHRTAALSLGRYPQETVKINLSYKSPTLVNQFIVINTKTEIVKDGTKVRIEGAVSTLGGRELVTGDGEFDVVVPVEKSSWKSIVGL